MQASCTLINEKQKVLVQTVKWADLNQFIPAKTYWPRFWSTYKCRNYFWHTFCLCFPLKYKNIALFPVLGQVKFSQCLNLLHLPERCKILRTNDTMSVQSIKEIPVIMYIPQYPQYCPMWENPQLSYATEKDKNEEKRKFSPGLEITQIHNLRTQRFCMLFKTKAGYFYKITQ